MRFLTFSPLLLLFEQSTRSRPKGECYTSQSNSCCLSHEFTLTEVPTFVFQHQVLQPCSSSSSHPQREWSKKLWNTVDKLLTTLVSDLMKPFFSMSPHRWSTTNQLSPSWSEIQTLQLLKSVKKYTLLLLYRTLESSSTVDFWTVSRSSLGQTPRQSSKNKELNKVL